LLGRLLVQYYCLHLSVQAIYMATSMACNIIPLYQGVWFPCFFNTYPIEYLIHVWSIKHRLITKLIAQIEI
jgi:hypothetical protein